MRGLAVGVVVQSRCADVAEGEFLYGWFGWQDYAAVGPAAIVQRATAAVKLSAYAGLLGINGLTAYLGLTKLGRPQPGERVLVSTAAGSVGSFVGQVARNLGAVPIGLAGDYGKVAACIARCGYVAGYNYKTADWGMALEAGPPLGIEHAPGAIKALYDGENCGKKLIFIG